MERTTVHIAVLVVAEDPATVDLANATFMSDKAVGAGHRIVAQEIVEDDEAAIRDQLARWVGQPHIDVVLSAGADDAAAAALGPLVTKPLPGLTDQLRLLARDRGSAARPVAARCSTKFVFLLPPEVGALGAALNQLVLPQLDSTAERNLVKDMPRHGGEAVPQAVAAEKTVTGAGLAPKIPAEPRAQRKTGANIVARNEARQAAAAQQDRTRVIDREKLDQQIARSANPSHDAVTRPHIDLATMLPPMPPGATERADTDEEESALESPTLDDPTLENPTAPSVRTVQPARLRGGSGPIGTAKARPPSAADEAPTTAKARPASAADEAPTTRAAPKPAVGVPATVAPVRPAAGAASAQVGAKPAASAAKPVGPNPWSSKPEDASTSVGVKPWSNPSTAGGAAKPSPSTPAASASASAKPSSTTTREPAKPIASVVPAKPIASVMPAKSAPATAATKPASSAPAKELPKPTPVSGVTTATAASATATSGMRTPSAGISAPVNGHVPPASNGHAAPAGNGHAPPARNGQAPPPIGEVRREDLEAAAEEAAAEEAAAEEAAAEEAIEAASSSDILEAVSADFEEVSTPPQPSRVSAQPIIPPAPAARPGASTPPAIPQRPATGPAPVVPQRPATGPAPVVPQRPATGPSPIVSTSAATSQPFTGPDLFQLPEGAQKKRRARTGTAIVRKSKRSVALTFVLLAGAAVAGFFAVVHFFPQFVGQGDSGSKGSATVAMQTATPLTGQAPANAPGSAAIAGSDVPAGSAQPTEPATEPTGSAVAGTEPAGSAVAAVEPAHPAAPTTPVAPTTPPVTHPAAHHASGGTTSGGTTSGGTTTAAVTHPEVAKPDETAKTETPKVAATPEPPPVEDGCDEVSCVMDHYEKACCARYKPAADSGFHPKGSVPDQLDRSMVKTGIEKVKPKVVACGEKNASKGEVKLSITVAPDGSVKSIAVDSSPDAALGDCVLAAVKRARFGPANNETSFVYPFVF